MIGRQSEISTLREFARSLTWPRTILLQGEAGIGKTRLVSQATQLLADADLAVVPLSPSEADRDLTRSALATLVDGLPGLD